MPYEELLKWVEFFSRRPMGWREDQRTFMLLQANGFKGKPEDIFTSLAMIKEHHAKATKAGKALPQGEFLKRMFKASGGDKSGWTPSWGDSNGKTKQPS